MREFLTLLALVAILTGRAFGALPHEQLAHLQEQLSNSDPKVRNAGLEDFMKANLVTAGNDIVPLLAKAVRDPDEKVRASAAAWLAAIGLYTSPKFARAAEDKTDLRSYPPLKEALVATFNDANENTRKNALAAYVMTFEVPPAIQNDLVSRYDSERPNSVFRAAILEALTIDGTSTPAAKAFVMRVAGTPDGAVALAQVIKDSKAPPVELLPVFANQLSSATDGPHRDAFAKAIAKFGASAKPYLPTLMKAADAEKDPVAKKNISDAAAAIQASK